MDFFIVKDYQGCQRVICGNAVDVIYQDNPRCRETKIVTRSGAMIVTTEPFDEVLKKYDNCLQRIRNCFVRWCSE